jgi:Holliday junction resolvasome RuvABC endonuclease subunit
VRLFVGIDPGAVSGAWGMVDHHGNYWSSGFIPHDAGRIKARDFRAELMQAIDGQDVMFCIEDVHAMPKQGVSSTFKFGMAVGAIQAIVELTRAPWVIVRPQNWKKDMGVTAQKSTSLDLARSLWPNAPLGRVKDHGVAEALLLAEWIRRQS